ncbi:MAG: HU family DNA-binding protein [Thermoanaerobaculia bacterium]
MAGKTELVEAIAEAAQMSRRDAETAYDAFLNALTEALRRGEKVNIAGLGSFAVADRAERQGRNPKTGESIRIAASRTVKFKAGGELKKLVNAKAS